MSNEEIILELLKTLYYARQCLVSAHHESAINYGGDIFKAIKQAEWGVDAVDKVFSKVGPHLSNELKNRLAKLLSYETSIPFEKQAPSPET